MRRKSVNDTGLTDTLPGSPIIVYDLGTLTGNNTSGITITGIATP